ncbi:hypothetical protein GWI33_002328 [Rhynchophorus ferrugineus]|uniref:PSP proline-rich domain-containing protein n=1 Tax=Rhynchophorus ferrugineus TaxID=354439 RepID=A0A834IKF3_RHYFE|nr:hypothetical protein GWI33_002328 [Rhynchophorus ferrugineus]
MESPGQQNKRKTYNSDIFEVSEKDLSPEPEEKIENEPGYKILKSTEVDVVNSRQKNEHNLEDCHNISGELDKSNEINIIVPDQELGDETDKTLESSKTVFEDSQVEGLEDGEVNDSIQNNKNVEATPCISIRFADKATAEIYKHEFCKFIQTFVEFEISLENDTTVNILKNPTLNPSEWVVLDNTIDILGNNKSNEEVVDHVAVETSCSRKQKKKKKTELFTVDTTSQSNYNENRLKYSTKFVINDSVDEKNGISVLQTICFNCKKQHSLIDCPEPKNYLKISINRQKFNAKTKVARYHLETDQKYGHLKPGKISPELRKALGLKKNQIPSYVYAMREKGYPPGWLEEAKFIESELNMFDIDGNSVKNTVKSKTRGLDPEKVVDYPGFNVPFEKGYKDEYDFYNVPPYSEDYSKENMLRYFEQNCMEKDLVDLEQEKESILAELQKSNDVTPWDFEGANDSNSVSDDNVKVQSIEPDINIKEIHDNNKEDEDGNNLNGGASEEAPNKFISFVGVNNTVKTIKDSTYGTPILKSSSPYNKLPRLENFTKGVSAVIDFENLPNSTGKYEQMYKVLQKVRDKLKVNDKM